MRTPVSSFAATEPDGSFALLLEDLAARGAAISDGSWAVPGRLVLSCRIYQHPDAR